MENLGYRRTCTAGNKQLRSISDRTCFQNALVEYLQEHTDALDEESKRRLTRNPLRILDSKNPAVQAVVQNAPKMETYLSEESQVHFEHVQNLLKQAGISYQVNPQLVRGLDYYNDTVFEWTTQSLGAQAAVCGGGRYNGLIEQLGGQPAPAVGFGLGMERLLLLLETLEKLPAQGTPDIYLCAVGVEAQYASIRIAQMIRSQCPELKLIADCNVDSFKKQLKRANNSGAKALILGEEEAKNHTVILKDLRNSGTQDTLTPDELCNTLKHFGE